MAMFRTFQTMKAFNITVFLVAIGLFICYFAYLFEFMFFFNPSWKIYTIPIQTFLFILLYWSFAKVYFTEPGNVPKFYALDERSYNRTDQRKYCLICHNFKPERTHHCSQCGKCILNMDHHCPWINNCIGFYNRKFFILFVLYLAINLIIASGQSGYLLALEMILLFKQQAKPSVHTAIRVFFFIFMFGLIFPISTFTGYHFGMVFLNKTTLSEMKRERDAQNGIPETQNLYDIGFYRNFTQVFGKRYWQWFLPITGTLTCNGIYWPENNLSFTQ